MSQTLLVQTGLAATQAALSRNDPGTVQAVTSLLGAGASVGVLLPWGRARESEADRLGLMAKAGDDPRAARGLWLPATRIRRIEAWLPEAMGYHRPR